MTMIVQQFEMYNPSGIDCDDPMWEIFTLRYYLCLPVRKVKFLNNHMKLQCFYMSIATLQYFPSAAAVRKLLNGVSLKEVWTCKNVSLLFQSWKKLKQHQPNRYDVNHRSPQPIFGQRRISTVCSMGHATIFNVNIWRSTKLPCCHWCGRRTCQVSQRSHHGLVTSSEWSFTSLNPDVGRRIRVE